MNVDEVKKYINLPVKIVLTDNNFSYYGTYKFIDDNTIEFTDRRRKSFPIDIKLIGLILPIDKIKYTDGGKNE